MRFYTTLVIQDLDDLGVPQMTWEPSMTVQHVVDSRRPGQRARGMWKPRSRTVGPNQNYSNRWVYLPAYLKYLAMESST